MTFFLFSKCLGFFTHSHNASAVSLIFFCDSEYDQSLVPSPDRAFCLVSTNNVPIFAHDKKGPPQTRLKHDCLFICLLRHCRKCLTVGKGLFFFLSSVPCLGKGSVLMGTGCLQDSVLILKCTLMPLSLGFLHLRVDT